MNLEKLSLNELKQLRKDVDAAIKSFQDRERKKALSALEAKAAEMGFTLAELTGNAKSRKVNPPKYRDPANPANTWSGRGRQPGWVKEILASGKTLDGYLI